MAATVLIAIVLCDIMPSVAFLSAVMQNVVRLNGIMQSVLFLHYAECCYAECYYAKCRCAFMLSDVVLLC
jgi:hypothetical protein